MITGAGSGIVRGIARSLANEGCHVVVADIDDESARLVAEEIGECGVEAKPARCDVTDMDAVEATA